MTKMERLIEKISKLKKGKTGKIVKTRMKEFSALGKKSSKEWFKELCFCVLTANCAANVCINIQKVIGEGFITLTERQLARKLRENGYRFPNLRANYIVSNRSYVHFLKKELKEFSDPEARKWLVDNIKGLGYKEASHFLRNVGYKNVAIIDFHIIDILAKNKLIQRPKTLTRTNYLMIEEVLRLLAEESGLNLAELDLYLWFLETGKVLK